MNGYKIMMSGFLSSILTQFHEPFKQLLIDNFETVDKLKQLVTELEIPIEKNNYFVKKAEDKLNKILER